MFLTLVMFVRGVIKPAIYALMSMIIIVLNVPTDSNKIELLKSKSLNDVSILVLMERFSVIIFVRSVILPAKGALLDLIIIVMSAQMDLYKMELTYSKIPKNV